MNVINIKFTPEECYILGFIWADGCITKPGSIRIDIIKDDAEELSSLFTESVLKMNKRLLQRTGNRQPSVLFHKGCKNFCNYLVENGYRDKSSSPVILHSIPDDLLYYWWRGFSDGDGCFYVGKSHCQFSITGPYDQDWNFVEKLLQSKNISYHVTRITNKYGKKSYIKTGKAGGKLFGNYIYQNFNKDKIGLTRKYNKYLQF